MKNITNKERFDILRGYYEDGKFYPKGNPVDNVDDLLHQMGFRNFDNFLVWWKSLTKDEIENGKKEWCPGDDCQSLLKRLLGLEKIRKKFTNQS